MTAQLRYGLLFIVAVHANMKAMGDDSIPSIMGTWKVVEIWQSGAIHEELLTSQSSWTFTNGFVIIRSAPFKDKPPLVINIKSRIDERSHQCDLTLAPAQRRAETSTANVLGIYAISGDTLKVCSHFQTRPNEFSTKAGDGRRLLILKRVVAPDSDRSKTMFDDKPNPSNKLNGENE